MGNGWEMENRKLKIENYGTLKPRNIKTLKPFKRAQRKLFKLFFTLFLSKSSVFYQS